MAGLGPGSAQALAEFFESHKEANASIANHPANSAGTKVKNGLAAPGPMR